MTQTFVGDHRRFAAEAKIEPGVLWNCGCGACAVRDRKHGDRVWAL